MKKRHLFLLVFAGFALFGLAGSARAETNWPDSLITGSSTPTLAAERMEVGGKIVHTETRTVFAGFVQGDQRTNSGTFSILLKKTGTCDLSDEGSSVIVINISYPGGTETLSGCGSNPTGDGAGNVRLTMRYNQGTWDADAQVMVYPIVVFLDLDGYTDNNTELNRHGYRFVVDSPANVALGALAGQPFVVSPSASGEGQGDFGTYSVTQHTPCGAGTVLSGIDSRDYDNFDGNAAQEDAGGNFEPLYVRLWDGGSAVAASSFAHEVSDTKAWPNVGNYGYEPQDSGSQQQNQIYYNFAPRKIYIYTVNHLGLNNFIRLNLPFNGNPYACPPLPPPPTAGGVDVSADYERGSNVNVSVNLIANGTCSANIASGLLLWRVLGPIASNGSFGPASCSGGHFTDTNSVALPPGTFESAPVGQNNSYTYQVSVDAGVTWTSSYKITVTVYEVPFVKFTGQDVRACSDASENRFMYDPTNSYNGSNSVLASIFKAANSDPPLYMGLPTTAGGAIDRLRTNWDSGAGCVTSGIEDLSVNNGSPHLYIDSDSNASSLPEITYVNGNIYIDPSVTLINKKILIATGSIFTCSTGLDGTGAIQPPTADWDTKCRNNLVVNGALYAGNTIYFQRSVGTRLLDGTPGVNGSTAETINFPSDMNFKDYLPPSGSGKFSSFRSVSPRL